MAPSDQDLARWLGAAQHLAHQAGAMLLERQRELSGRPPEFKGRRELVTAADREAEDLVVGGLRDRFPEHAILAEEGTQTEAGHIDGDGELMWVIDPVDGTTNFVHGLPFFAVAIALVHRAPPHQGLVSVVHAPALGHTYTAIRGGGAQRNGEPIRVTGTDELAAALLVTGFSYNRNEPGRDDNSGRLAKMLPLCRDLRRFGSAELDLCQTAAGIFDGYWEMYLMPYDVAAGALIVQEAGGRVTDLEGGDDWLFGRSVLASNGALHQQVLDVVGGPTP